MAKGTKAIIKRETASQEVGVRCDLNFSYTHIMKMIRENQIAERISVQAAIYLAAVLEYITAEVLDSTIIAMRDNSSKQIRPFDIVKGISSDHELIHLFKESEIQIFDPSLKANRTHVIGRGVEEKYYKGKKKEN